MREGQRKRGREEKGTTWKRDERRIEGKKEDCVLVCLTVSLHNGLIRPLSINNFLCSTVSLFANCAIASVAALIARTFHGCTRLPSWTRAFVSLTSCSTAFGMAKNFALHVSHESSVRMHARCDVSIFMSMTCMYR